MVILITESQFKKLQSEQTAFERMLDRSYSTPEGSKKMIETNKNLIQDLKKLRSQNPVIFDTIVQVGAWFIPYVGPYLSTAYGSAIAIDNIKKGKYEEGVIGLITSPLALTRTIKVLQIMGSSGNTLKMLQTINKSGLPVLISQGKQQFLEWGVKNFGDDFMKLTNLLTNKPKMQELLKSIGQK